MSEKKKYTSKQYLRAVQCWKWVADELATQAGGPSEPEMPVQRWDRDDIQFPRLLGEMYATITFTEEQKKSLCDSMDLDWEEIIELLERADTAWQKIKNESKGKK